MKELIDGFSVERLAQLADTDNWVKASHEEVQSLAGIALAVKQAQLSDLKRYELDQSNCDSCGQDCGADMSEDSDGDYVLFADVVSNLTALQNFRDAMLGIGHIRRTLEETFGGLHGTHVEPDVLVECKAICDAICAAYRKPEPSATAPVVLGYGRADFEAWMLKRWGRERRHDDFAKAKFIYGEDYADSYTRCVWKAWSASRAAMLEVAPQEAKS